MAFDMFLKMDGIDGESRDAKHKNEIEVLSYSWGVSNSGSLGAGGGGGAGKATFQDFSFVHRIDKASPNLFLACASGQHIKQAVLVCRSAGGGGGRDFLKITFTDVLVASFQQGGSAGSDDLPVESVTLNYARIEKRYTEAGAGGRPGSSHSAGWGLKKNRKL